ncbi:hypothetical protein BD408DRAFT_347416 [Parasitella parasitica]|nr:hypothetical protein BD408DRAFT_347416 [Parasitella parasitica]
MASKQRKPSIQPRATKASMLRLQKQQSSDAGLVTATKREEEPVLAESATCSVKPRVVKGTTGPTAGVKEFMAKQRARMAQSDTQKQPVAAKKENPIRKSGNFMMGAQRYRDGATEDQPTVVETRKIQTVIKQAKSMGKLDISSRGLTKIPEEVLKM